MPILYGDASPLPSHCTTNCYTQLHRWLLEQPMLMHTPASLDGHKTLQNMTITNRPPPQTQPETPMQLGRYYEHLIHQYLCRSAELIDLRKNIQVFEQQRTVGEFDFIWLDRHYDCHHMECAIKFYLCDGPPDQLSSFVGPNRQDTLARKWQQMLDKQIRLSSITPGIVTCEQLGFPAPRHQHLLIQGYLFYPWHRFRSADRPALHRAINSQHSRGWWLHQHALNQKIPDKPDIALQIRHKPDWLLDWHKPPTQSRQDIDQWLSQAIRPVMVSRLKKVSKESWRELDRGFVVPDTWSAPSESE